MSLDIAFPATPGPTPTGPYEYLELPPEPGGFQGGIKPDTFVPFTKLNSFFVESYLGQFNIPGERIDLIDGTRLYRVEIKYLWKFFNDKNGPFLKTPKRIYRLVVDQPKLGMFQINTWTTVGL